MAILINTNTAALGAQRNLRSHGDAQKQAVEQLASGSRVNHANEDAASLSIAHKMRAEIRSMRQAIRNAQDGISVVQVAEGGMNEMSNMLVRMRELAIQAASDTVGQSERKMISREVSSLREEIGRISQTIEYNGQRLLDVTAQILEIQIGTKDNPDNDRLYYDVKQSNVSPQNLRVGSVGTETREQARESLATIDSALSRLSRGRAALGALQNRLQAAASNLGIYSENLSSAKSRIEDTDMAEATAQLLKSNVLQQTTLAVLSNANTEGAIALKLLG